MRKITGFIVAAVVAIFFLQPRTANAITATTTDFYFSGTCSTDCSGSATAELAVTGYTSGVVTITEIATATFTYTSSYLGTITSTGDLIPGALTTLTSTPGEYDFAIMFTADVTDTEYTFDTNAEGLWCIAVGSSCSSSADAGNDGQWTTPLPPALPLFGTVLGVGGLFGWRRKRKDAAAIAAT